MATRVLVVYHYFAHYRRPVVEALLSDVIEGFEYHFASDLSSNISSLNVMSFSGCDRHSVLNNVWIGKLLWQRRLFNVVRELKPDAVILLGNYGFLSTIFLTFVLKVVGRPVLFWGHGRYGSEVGITLLVRRAFNCLPDKWLVYGENAKKLMIGDGIAESKIQVIYNSLDLRAQNEIYKILSTSELTSCDREYRAVFIGRLTEVKRLDLALRALSILHLRGLPLTLTLIGDGPMRLNLEALAAELEISSSVTFVGAVYDENVIGEYLYNADFCLSPGNVGLTAMHSLAYGTPVITHGNLAEQMPEAESVLDGITGVFFEQGSYESLADAIQRWERISVNKRAKVRRDCRSLIFDKYNAQKQVELINSAVTSCFEH